MMLRAILIFLSIIAISCSDSPAGSDEVKETATGTAVKTEGMPFQPGETITYAIKKMKMKAGEAVLTFKGKSSVEGQEVYEIDFTVTAINLRDEEKIFVDPKTFLPVQVNRLVKGWGKNETIIESYDQKSGTVKVVKTPVGGKVEEQTLKKDPPIDNIYAFLYRYRTEGVEGKKDFTMNLPTKTIKLLVKKETPLKAGGKEYQTFYLQSDPRQYEMWFDKSEKLLPLRIDGAAGFGDTSMTMTEYKEK